MIYFYFFSSRDAIRKFKQNEIKSTEKFYLNSTNVAQILFA